MAHADKLACSGRFGRPLDAVARLCGGMHDDAKCDPEYNAIRWCPGASSSG